MSDATTDTFLTAFDNAGYLRKTYAHPTVDVPTYPVAMRRFLMKSLHCFYSKYGPSLKDTPGRMVEFGGGPVISNVLSAVPYVKDIVFTDYTKGGREEVEKWRDCASDAHDWGPFIQYTVEELEGDNRPEAALEREADLRGKIRHIVHCDAHTDPPIVLSGGDNVFDLISISFCFESACHSYDSVTATLRRLSGMLAPGGLVRVNGVYGGSFYHVMGDRFFNLTQSEDTLRKSFEDAGFQVLEFDLFMLDKPVSHADYKGMYHIVARGK